jgi:hypothetical protein
MHKRSGKIRRTKGRKTPFQKVTDPIPRANKKVSRMQGVIRAMEAMSLFVLAPGVMRAARSKEKLRIANKRNREHRLATDDCFRIVQALRSRLGGAVRAKGAKRAAKAAQFPHSGCISRANGNPA